MTSNAKVICICLILVTGVNLAKNKSKKSSKIQTRTDANDACFCELQGEVDDCSCKVGSLDSLNNKIIYPRLQSLLTREYFKFFKVNLNKECPFWADDSRCAIRNCAVDICPEDEVPEGLKGSDRAAGDKYSAEAQDAGCDEEHLGYVDTSISEESQAAFKNWTQHDDALAMFCEIDDETSPDSKYVDLLLNPERYTGYKGESPLRIWNSIYNENCFIPETSVYGKHSQSLSEKSLEGLCLEKRAFYRMVSGLHTSINIHLSARYLFTEETCFGEEKWGPHLAEFQKRFDPSTTNGRGPQYLKNLYFAYLVELRALAKAAPYLEQEDYFTGNKEEDEDVRQGIRELLKVIKEFPDHFDESKLFQGHNTEVKQLKREFQDHFRNISRIMDCVGCDKCRVWGKLQVQGMGTALKILFSGDGMGPLSTVNAGSKRKFQLRRTEIISLFNAFGRLSSSIHAVETFREMVR